MTPQDQSKSSIEVPDDSIHDSVSDATAPPQGSSITFSKEVPVKPKIDWISDSDADSTATSPTSSTAATSPPSSTMPRLPQIPRVPGTVRENHDYDKYYVPKVVSIGPYHFGNPKLQMVQKLKLGFALKLCKNYEGVMEKAHSTLRSLLSMLCKPETVKELRGYYEEGSTTQFSDEEFTKMMLLDCCFILYFIRFIKKGSYTNCSELKSNEIFFVRRDLFLLENQIPFKVLKEVINFVKICSLSKYVYKFIIRSSFVKHKKKKRKWKTLFIGGDEEPDHLLGAVHGKHSTKAKHTTRKINPFKFQGCNFRKVTELADVGIYFMPIKDTLSMTHIEFVKSWSGFSAYVKLPPITMSDYTRPMLLNLMAYEMCRFSINESWVTSYVYLLGYLIDDIDDVKLLRKSWVLENYLVSDKEVVDLFDEIGTDLVENSDEYLEARYKIQKHYECWRNTVFSELKNEYFKSPWAFIALLGALVALFLTGVQTYFAVWSPKNTCDDLCMFLKMNHHL